MFRSKERTGLYTMAAEVTATYGGFYNNLACWLDVYWDYRLRDVLEQDFPSQYLNNISNLQIQPMSNEIEMTAWSRSDFNVDILVGCKDRMFYLLHNINAFFEHETFQVTGITGQRFESPFMQVGGLPEVPFFTTI